MPFTPDDPRRREEERFFAIVKEAYARVYEITHELSAEMRAIMIQCEESPGELRGMPAEAQESYPKTREAMTDSVGIRATLLENNEDLSLKITIQLACNNVAEGMKQLIRLDQRETFVQLRPELVNRVIARLEPEYREALGEYVMRIGYGEAAEELDDDFERLAAMEGMLETLRERIVAGKLPKPPSRIRFSPESGYFGNGGPVC